MRITAAIGVIDEIECLQACVDHHAAIGIECFVITDLGSTDGTKDLLSSLSQRANIRVLDGCQSLTESEWPQAMQQFAYQCFRPEYIVYIDPDEFWLPASGKLLQHYGQFDVITPARYNVIPDSRLAAGDWRMHEPLLDRIVFRQRLMFSPDQQLDHTTPVIRYAPGPKVMHKAVPASIAAGWHGAESELLQKRASPNDLIILHFPVSTYERFRRKVANAETYLDENRHRLGPNEAWHWRIWVRAHRDRRLRESYDSQVFTDEQISGFVQSGVGCPARDIFPK